MLKSRSYSSNLRTRDFQRFNVFNVSTFQNLQRFNVSTFSTFQRWGFWIRPCFLTLNSRNSNSQSSEACSLTHSWMMMLDHYVMITIRTRDDMWWCCWIMFKTWNVSWVAFEIVSNTLTAFLTELRNFFWVLFYLDIIIFSLNICFK